MAYEIDPAIEPVSDGFGEGIASQQVTNVCGGCAITYNGANMTFDIAAGMTTVNGVLVPVAAQTNVSGLTADTTYERWAWIVTNGSGTASVIAGTPALNPAVPPVDYTTEASHALVLIPANQTIANTIPTKLDKRIPSLVQVPILANDWTQSNSVTFTNVGLSFYIEAAGTYTWELQAQCSVTNAAGIEIGMTVPTAAIPAGQGVLFDAATVVADAQGIILSGGGSHIALIPAATGIVLKLSGTVLAAGTAGTVQLQARQSVMDVSTIAITAAASSFIVRKVL